MRPTTIERFEAKYVPEPNTGCWLWLGTILSPGIGGPGGYGLFWHAGRQWLAHRWSYTHFVGPIPDGLDLDHLCRVRCCVNPEHLEPVTRKENINRGLRALGLDAASQTHCPSGHPYSGENLYISPASGKRCCRACLRTNYKPRRWSKDPRFPAH